MEAIDGIWRLIDSRAFDENSKLFSEKPPYGAHPMGTIVFSHGRMLAALCNGDSQASLDGKRGFSSYGGYYNFDGTTLDCKVDIASDPQRIGGHQIRTVIVISKDEMLLRPPPRMYGEKFERRELIWQRVWQPRTKEEG